MKKEKMYLVIIRPEKLAGYALIIEERIPELDVLFEIGYSKAINLIKNNAKRTFCIVTPNFFFDSEKEGKIGKDFGEEVKKINHCNQVFFYKTLDSSLEKSELEDIISLLK